ncbi:hypothetical protein D9M68_988320 [compost metagenome]
MSEDSTSSVSCGFAERLTSQAISGDANQITAKGAAIIAAWLSAARGMKIARPAITMAGHIIWK